MSPENLNLMFLILANMFGKPLERAPKEFLKETFPKFFEETDSSIQEPESAVVFKKIENQ